MVAVPRIFEKIYAGILAQLETTPVKKKMFNMAMRIGRKISQKKMNREPVSPTLAAEYIVANKLVFSKIKEAFGGRLRFAVSGGAPLAQEIAEFMHAAGILILEGYGLTETTAAVTVNTPFHYRFGTVGRPIGEVQIKIAEDGEILVKSDKVMKEYYNNPEATRASLHDGWFATGDIGEILPTGELKITDRKRDLIKTAGGKYVAPQKLENLLKAYPIISNVLIHGDQKKYVVALVTLDPAALIQFAGEYDISYSDIAALTQNPKVNEHIRKIMADVNTQLSSYETIKSFKILPHEFTIEAGELTPSLKVKRKFLDNKFKDLINSMY
jgi:long-chain acyl-CoA synthetase